MAFSKGDFVFLKQSGTAVVIATDEDPGVPAGHLVVWFGHTGHGNRPQVWTLPAKSFQETPKPLLGR
jgi:hypothetical protein